MDTQFDEQLLASVGGAQISRLKAETNGFETKLLGLMGQFALIVTHHFEQTYLRWMDPVSMLLLDTTKFLLKLLD